MISLAEVLPDEADSMLEQDKFVGLEDDKQLVMKQLGRQLVLDILGLLSGAVFFDFGVALHNI